MHVVFTLIWLTEETEKALRFSIVSNFPQNVCLDRRIVFLGDVLVKGVKRLKTSTVCIKYG